MTYALANLIWSPYLWQPELRPHQLMMIWWIVPLGLTIEWPAVAYLMNRSLVKSVWPTIAMNLCSALVGTPIYGSANVLFGMLIEAFMKIFGSSANLLGMLPTVIVVAAISTGIEYAVLFFFFKVNPSQRRVLKIGLLIIANMLSAWIAAAGFSLLLLHPTFPPGSG